MRQVNLYSSAEVPKRHCMHMFTPENSTSEGWTKEYNRLRSKVEGGGILVGIIGGRGTGKTQMGACLIGFAACVLGKTAKYIKAYDVFVRLRDTMRKDNGSEAAAIRELVLPDVLVIDAYEVRGDTPFEDRSLNNIIDKRYDEMKTTIIISNDTEESFLKAVGNSIEDRMTETGEIVVLNGKSFRGNK